MDDGVMFLHFADHVITYYNSSYLYIVVLVKAKPLEVEARRIAEVALQKCVLNSEQPIATVAD